MKTIYLKFTGNDIDAVFDKENENPEEQAIKDVERIKTYVVEQMEADYPGFLIESESDYSISGAVTSVSCNDPAMNQDELIEKFSYHWNIAAESLYKRSATS